MSDDTELEEDGEILMGLWDCDSCETKGIRGDLYECSNCSAPRSEDVQFYLPDQAEVITDEKGLAAAKAGSDWQCAYCDSWTPALDKDCSNCGAGFAESEKRKEQKVYEGGAVPKSTEEAEANAKAEQQKAHQPASGDVASTAADVAGAVVGGAAMAVGSVVSKAGEAVGKVDAKQAAKTAGKVAGVGLMAVAGILLGTLAVICLLCMLLSYMARPSEAIGTVTAHHWSIEQQVESYQSLTKAGWSKQEGAYNVKTETRLYEHKKVFDHNEKRTKQETYKERDGTKTETYKETVVVGKKKVPDGTKVVDLGNGRFKKVKKFKEVDVTKQVTKTREVPRYVTKTRTVTYDEPIYRKVPINKTYYTFQINRWMSADPVKAEGNDQNIKEPVVIGAIEKGQQPKLGDKRKTKRDASYSVTLSDPQGKKWTFNVDKQRFLSVEPGEKVTLVVQLGIVKRFLTAAETSKRGKK